MVRNCGILKPESLHIYRMILHILHISNLHINAKLCHGIRSFIGRRLIEYFLLNTGFQLSVFKETTYAMIASFIFSL